MKRKYLFALVASVAAIGADYTVRKTISRTGDEYAIAATLKFDAPRKATPVIIRIRVKSINTTDDELLEYTPEFIQSLPDQATWTNKNGVVALDNNRFKQWMTTAFSNDNIVNAIAWSRVGGREVFLVSTNQ